MEEASADPPPEGHDPENQAPGVLAISPADNPEFIMEALQKNRACQKSMTAVLEAIRERIRANAILQKKARLVVKVSKEAGAKPKETNVGVRTAGLDWPGRKKPKSRRIGSSRIFIGMDGTGPEENPDIARTEPLHELLRSCGREHRWTDGDKEKLRNAVRQQVQERWVQELMAGLKSEGHENGSSALSALQKGMAQLKERPVTDADVAAVLPSLDWDKVLLLSGLAGKTAEDCQACWTAECAPGINRGPWTSEEDERLKELATKHEGHDWESVASELQTGRTAVACLMRYQRELREDGREPGPREASHANGAVVTEADGVPDMAHPRRPGRPQAQWKQKLGPVRKQLWTEEENLRLRYAVAALGTSSWVKVAEVVGTRTDPQCRDRWMNVLDPSVDASPWTSDEDARLEDLVQRLGAGKWAQLAEVFNVGRPRKRTDDRLRKRYEALVASDAIAPVVPTTSPEPAPALQLVLVDPRMNSLLRRREAAQAREAKRKVTVPPRKPIEPTSPKPARKTKAKPLHGKKTARIRKTGKSRLAPPLALVPVPPAAPPVVEPGLSNVLRLLQSEQVQPTHVGRTGKPAAVINGKSVHFMQRHVQPAIPVAQPVLASQPPPINAQANGNIGSTPISGDQQAGPWAEGAPDPSVVIKVAKPKLTPEERLAQRRERDRRRRAADRAKRQSAEEGNGTAAERVAARLAKEQERQEKRRKREEERRAKKQDVQKRRQEEREELLRRRQEERERVRREQEEVRKKKMQERQAERDEKQRKRAEEEAAKRADEALKKAAAQAGGEETKGSKEGSKRKGLNGVTEKDGASGAGGKGQKGQSAKDGVRRGASKKGAAQRKGTTGQVKMLSKMGARKENADDEGAEKESGRKTGGGEEKEKGEGPGGAAPRVSRAAKRLSAGARTQQGIEDSGEDQANRRDAKSGKTSRKSAGGTEGTEGRPAKRARKEGTKGAEEDASRGLRNRGSDNGRVAIGGDEAARKTRKRAREEIEETAEERTLGNEITAMSERQKKRGRVAAAEGPGAGMAARRKGRGTVELRGKVTEKPTGKKTGGREKRDATGTGPQERAEKAGGVGLGARRTRRGLVAEEGEGGAGREIGHGKRKETAKESGSPMRTRRASREGAWEEKTEGRKDAEEKQRTKGPGRSKPSLSATAAGEEAAGEEESDLSEKLEKEGQERVSANRRDGRTRSKKAAENEEPRGGMTSSEGDSLAGPRTRGKGERSETVVLRVSARKKAPGQEEKNRLAVGRQKAADKGRSLGEDDTSRKKDGSSGARKGRSGVSYALKDDGRAKKMPRALPDTGLPGKKKAQEKRMSPRQERGAGSGEGARDQVGKDAASTAAFGLRRSERKHKREF